MLLMLSFGLGCVAGRRMICNCLWDPNSLQGRQPRGCLGRLSVTQQSCFAAVGVPDVLLMPTLPGW